MAQPGDHQHPKATLYQLFAQVGQAPGNPHRLELLDLLMQAPRTVDELVAETQLSVANASQHLQRLKQSRLVVSAREGNYVRYRLADASIGRLWLELRAIAEAQIADVEKALDVYRARRYEFEQISAGELRTRLAQGEVCLIDARPQVEYEAGHIPGALSLPLAEVERRLDELPADLPIVAYCRGPYCVIADEVLAILAGHGRQVLRLEEGVANGASWRQPAVDDVKIARTKSRRTVIKPVEEY